MKKVKIVLGAFALVALFAAALMVWKPAPANASASLTPEEAAIAAMPFEPGTLTFDPNPEVRDGFYVVPVRVGEEKLRALWMQNAGNMEGFTLEKAKNAKFIAKVGTAPCSCSMAGACMKMTPKTKDNPTGCEDGCNPAICENSMGVACATTKDKLAAAKPGETQTE